MRRLAKWLARICSWAAVRLDPDCMGVVKVEPYSTADKLAESGRALTELGRAFGRAGISHPDPGHDVTCGPPLQAGDKGIEIADTTLDSSQEDPRGPQ